MIALLMSLLSSSALSTGFGALFAWLNRKTDMQAKQMELDQERARWAHDLVLRDKDLEFARIEAAGRERIAVIEGDATVDSARMKAIADIEESERIEAAEIAAAGKLGWMLVFVLVLRKSIRPVATVLLLGSALLINFILLYYFVSTWRALGLEERILMGKDAAAWVCGQAGMVLGYWFVSRGSSK